MKAVAKTVEPAGREATLDHIRPQYLEALTLVERLHRRLLDVIKDEFDRRGRTDVNPTQALIVYTHGDQQEFAEFVASMISELPGAASIVVISPTVETARD
ncbi:MAG: hypothetical protein WBZ27_11430, partial [Pseudolabrys sp.]